MKTVFTTLVAFVCAFSAQSQGFVNFDTKILGTTSQVKDVDTVTLLSGSTYLAQLYAVAGAGGSEGSLVAVGSPVPFRAGVNAGWVQTSGSQVGGPFNGVAVDPVVQVFSGGAAGGAATLQLRAWQVTGNNFSSYSAALTGGAATGKSALLSLASTGNGSTVLPVDLTGLQGFSLTAVPEPTTVLLGLAGGAALLIRRRKD